MGKPIRLDRFLTEMKQGSRSQMKEAAKKGRIRVNGEPEKKTDRKIDPERDTVTLDGIPVAYQAWEYYMLNKPQGVVSATEDNLHRTVIDLIEDAVRKDLFPVGRLDIDTEGLLLITNDGDLAHRLLSPNRHVDKQYYARIEGGLPCDAVSRMAEGMTLKDGTVVKPADLTILGQNNEGSEEDRQNDQNHPEGQHEILLTIREGKFHQVKRMFEALDCRVVYLKRLSMGSLKLDDSLQPGEYRKLTEEELESLNG